MTQSTLGAGETLLIGHPGIIIGGTASLRRYPEHGLVVAVTSNVTFAELAPLAGQVAALFAAAREAATALPLAGEHPGTSPSDTALNVSADQRQ